MDYSKEIKTEIADPSELGAAIFSAFNCTVYEQVKPTKFIYTAKNTETGLTYTLSKRANPITEKDLPALAKKIHHSPIAGYGRYLIDRPYGETLPNKTAYEILKLYNSTDYIYTAMSNQKILILETQNSITESLLTAVIIKRGRVNNFKLSTEYGDIPIVIGTPNKGKIQKQIDKLSLSLLENGNILTPLEKDFYLCSHYGLFSAKLPDYQLLIIDEAHKFPQAVRKVFTQSIDLNIFTGVHFKGKEATETTKKLISEAKRFIKDFDERHLENLTDIADRLLFQADHSPDFTLELLKIQDLTDYENLVWIEDNEIKYAPKNPREKLQERFWSKEKPVILTSSILSYQPNFELFKKSLGLKDNCSSFNFSKKQRVIEFCDRLPYPNMTSYDYIEELATEIELLGEDNIAFLFTSFTLLKAVQESLDRKDLPFYLFDGRDIPKVSTIVITKLPFLTPDAINRYEQAQYENFETYRREVLIPDMLIKLRRATLNADKVIILDSRKEYRKYVTEAINGLHT